MAAPSADSGMTDNQKNLLEAVTSGNDAEVKQLLEQTDVEVDFLDGTGMTPMMHAAYKGNADLCRYLLSKGADVNSNYHDSGYSPLMFAALSGNTNTVNVLLSAGAKVHHQNSLNRNAAQMAAFIGQHQVVSVINNFLSEEDILYYTKPQGFEKEAKLKTELASPLYKYLLMSNLNPVKLSMYLQEHPEMITESRSIGRVIDLIVEKMMKQSETNEIMAVKFSYLGSLLKQCSKSKRDKGDNLETWIKFMLRGREGDAFQENQEKFVRAALKEFPYIECALLQQMVRQIAPVRIGNSPTAMSILNSGVNGQRFASSDDVTCNTCGEQDAKKQCSACKMVHYCDQKCQKLHWFTHKKFCKQLAEEYKRYEEQRKQEKEEGEKRAKEEAEKKSKEEAEMKEMEKKLKEQMEKKLKEIELSEKDDAGKTDEEKQEKDDSSKIETEVKQ